MVKIFVLVESGVWVRWGECSSDAYVISQTLSSAMKSGKFKKAKAVDSTGNIVDMTF